MKVGISIVLLMLLPSCAEKEDDAIDPKGLTGPITAALTTEGRFANGRSWQLTVNADRTANLNIDSYPASASRTFAVTEAQIEELRSLLIDERFFELNEEYGQIVPDGSTRTITITCGERSHTVQLHFLMNWVRGDTSRLREPARAVRVWRHIRRWFDDAEAVDLERYDQMVLDAAPR